MEAVKNILLIIHIATGSFALIGGAVALFAAKGGKAHRLSGKIFYSSMMAVAASAIILAVIKSSAFLLLIGIFSFQLTFNGYRSVINKSLNPSSADWLVLWIGLLNSGLFFKEGNPILLGFGLLSSTLTILDLRIFIRARRGQIQKNDWLKRHIGMMTGAFISTCTAFLVVNVKSTTFYWLPWVLPSIFFTPFIIYYTRKYTAKKKVQQGTLLISAFLLFTAASEAQPYVQGKTRHRFAQLTLGTDINHYPSITTVKVLDNAGQLTDQALNPLSESRLIIGGTHFWGHADFFIAIPVYSFGKSAMHSSVETGARILPWRIESGKLRPFAGISWMPVTYRQGAGALQFTHRYPLSGGLIYNQKNHLLGLHVSFIPNNKTDYYLSMQIRNKQSLHPLSFGISYRYMLETTLSAERDWLSGRSKKLADTLGKMGRLDGLTVGVGVSSSFYLKNSSHNQSKPFLGQHKAVQIFPEFALGYYLHKADLQFNLAYRSMKSEQKAFAHVQIAQRRSIALEAYKFLGDYHGFVPFAGLTLGWESLLLSEKEPDGEQGEFQDKQLKPGFVFGWDIRPDRLQKFYLRTNLRWTPDLKLATNGANSFAFDQLEINFIELVVFPGRFR